MKKNAFKAAIIICLLSLSNVCAAQSSLSEYFGAITNMPKFFSTLIKASNNLGSSVDKYKYKKFSSEVEYAITELKGDKLNLLNTLNKGAVDKQSLAIEISIFQKSILKLKEALDDNKDLIKSLSADGFNEAIQLSGNLNRDFTAKQQLLNEIIKGNNTAPDIATIKVKLQQSIDLLNESIVELRSFNKSLGAE